MDCKVYKLKINPRKLSAKNREKLVRVFLEAKWLKNHIIAGDILFDVSSTIREVGVKLPDGTVEKRKLKNLSSHMKDSLISSMKSNVKGLSVLKSHGRKVGGLNFCSKVSAIPLKEYGNTYVINREKNRVKVQKVGWLRVSGLDNIPEDVEFANAVLVDKADGYFIHVTTYTDNSPERVYLCNEVLGIDMGIATSITTSNGEKFDLYVEEPDRLKGLRRKLSRQEKGSNNYRKTLRSIAVVVLKTLRRKKDMAYKFVSDLSHYEHVYFQDEMLSSWKKRDSLAHGGRKIQCGILGLVKTMLASKDWATMLPSSTPTTQLCICGAKNKHQLSHRVYFCSNCGYTEDRDVHAAKNMIRCGTRKNTAIPQGLGITPVEKNTSTLHFNFLEGRVSDYSAKQEARPSSVGG